MKKLLALILVVFVTGIFAADWYSNSEKMNIKPEVASKDTAWYSYANSGSGWTIAVPWGNE